MAIGREPLVTTSRNRIRDDEPQRYRPARGRSGPRRVSSERNVPISVCPETSFQVDGQLLDHNLSAAIAECSRSKPSFFTGLNQTVQALVPAYSLMKLMLLGGEAAVDQVLSHPEFSKRKRAPRRSNPALIAILLAATPETERERKWCSDWANLLIAAEYHDVHPGNFVGWASGITLSECKASVRRRNQERTTHPAMNIAGKLAWHQNRGIEEKAPARSSPTREIGQRLQLVFPSERENATLTITFEGASFKNAAFKLRTASERVAAGKAIAAAWESVGVAHQIYEETMPKLIYNLSEKGSRFAQELRRSVQTRQKSGQGVENSSAFKGIESSQKSKIKDQSHVSHGKPRQKQHQPLIFRNRPPFPSKSKQPPEIVNAATYRESHRWDDERKKTYLEIGRRSGQTLEPCICRELENERLRIFSAVDQLFANNSEARINFAEVAERHVKAHNVLGRPGTSFFVTVTPGEFAQSELEAASFNPQRIQSWIRARLPDFDFIGIVEAALYEHGSSGETCKRDPMISWHVHMHFWNTTYSRLNKALAKIRRNHPSFVAGRPSARCDVSKSPEEVTRRTFYMLKIPQKQYHVYRTPAESVVDPATGEIVAKPHIQKRPLRTGQRIRMCRVMTNRFLDRLLFGQGDGTKLRRLIVTEARRHFDTEHRHAEIRRTELQRRARRV